MSSELSSTSRARFRPMSSGSRAMGPPPATIPTPTSHCERMAFSRLAKLMSQASVISLPLPVARPRMRAMEATGTRVSRARKSGQVGKPGQEIGVIQEVVVDRAVEDHDPDLLVGLEGADQCLELPDHFRAHHVDRRVVDRDTPIGGRPPGHANLCGCRNCVCSCHWILLCICWSRTLVDYPQRFLEIWIICSLPGVG